MDTGQNSTKICSKCKLDLPVENFSRHSSAPDGLKWYCRACSSDYGKKWREANREKINACTRRYRANNRESVAATRRAYYQSHREEYSTRQRHRNAMYAAAGVTRSDLERLRFSANSCAYCGKPFTRWPIPLNDRPVTDHVIPLTLGGSGGLTNLVIVCRFCNGSKCTQTLGDWAVAQPPHVQVRVAGILCQFSIQ